MNIESLLIQMLTNYLDRNKIHYEQPPFPCATIYIHKQLLHKVWLSNGEIWLNKYDLNGGRTNNPATILNYPDIQNPAFEPDRWVEGILSY